MEYLTIANTIILLFIAKFIIFYERRKISFRINHVYIGIWLLKWNYKDCEYYRHKTIYYKKW